MRMKVLLVLLGLVAGGVTLILIYREEGESLTRAALDQAIVRWEKSGPANYDLEVTVAGRQKGRHRIEVRAGKVVKMTTGGAPAPERVWKYWSVAGMFDFLGTELENLDRAKRAYGVDDPADVVLRVVFDEEHGLPRRFLRHVLGKHAGIEWTVTAFVRK